MGGVDEGVDGLLGLTRNDHRDVDSKTFREHVKRGYRGHVLPGLDLREVGFCEAAVPSERLLSERRFLPEGSNPCAETTGEGARSGAARHTHRR